jgi:biotin transport system substrate-specific component
METQAATLRLAVFPRTSLLTDALLVCAGTAFVALAAQVSFHLGFTPVPITLQTFAVLLVASAYGPLLGTASLLLYLLIGIAGAPVYAEHKHGWDVFVGSSGGYIVGFVAAAALTGYLAERGWDRRFSTAISVMLTGNVVIYGFGLLWFHHWLGANPDIAKDIGLGTSWNGTLTGGLYPFVPGDVVKLYLAALALPGAWKLVERVKRSDT